MVQVDRDHRADPAVAGQTVGGQVLDQLHEPRSQRLGPRRARGSRPPFRRPPGPRRGCVTSAAVRTGVAAGSSAGGPAGRAARTSRSRTRPRCRAGSTTCHRQHDAPPWTAAPPRGGRRRPRRPPPASAAHDAATPPRSGAGTPPGRPAGPPQWPCPPRTRTPASPPQPQLTHLPLHPRHRGHQPRDRVRVTRGNAPAGGSASAADTASRHDATPCNGCRSGGWATADMPPSQHRPPTHHGRRSTPPPHDLSEPGGSPGPDG